MKKTKSLVVSDSSTLIILLDLDQIQLLSNLYSTIYIPPEVESEITKKNDPKLPGFIKAIKIQEDDLLDELSLLLDRGESEAIVLAKQKNLPLIIDEKKGRQIASNLDIPVIGLLGILYLNIKKEYFSETQVREFLKQIQKNHFRISQKLINKLFSNL